MNSKDLTQEPIVDIIIPYWNQNGLTKQCIRSIFSYVRVPYKLTLIDNGSDVFDQDLFEMERSGVRFIHNKENLGFVKAVNQGLKESVAPFACFMNNDMVATEFCFERMLAHLEAHPEVGAVGPCSNFVMWKQAAQLAGDTGKLTPEEINDAAQENYEKCKGQLLDTKLLIGICVLMRREVLEEVGLLDEAFGIGCSDDFDYSIRIRKAGWRLGVARDVFIYHYGHQTFEELKKDPEFDFDKQLTGNQSILREKWGDEEVDDLFEEDNSLGFCLIVKDEEKTLPRCLENLKEVADEIVIVDTGSTDRTKEVAREYTDKIFDYEWGDDFSAARNFAFSKAESGWICWLDADDYVQKEQADAIKNLTLNSNGTTAFAFPTHCLGDTGELLLINTRIRLVKNRRSYRFRSRLHETLDLRGDDFQKVNLPIIHGGPEIAKFKDKSGQHDFNIRILLREIEEKPEDLFVNFNLARAYKGAGRIQDAETRYKLVMTLDKFKSNFRYLAALGLAELYLDEKEYDEAIDYGYEAIKCTNLRAEPFAVIGLAYFYKKVFHKAAAAFENALQLKPQFDTFIPLDLGVYNYKSWVNLGSCHFNLGQLDKAEECYEKALNYNPLLEDARRNLAIVRDAKQNQNLKLIRSDSEEVRQHGNRG